MVADRDDLCGRPPWGPPASRAKGLRHVILVMDATRSFQCQSEPIASAPPGKTDWRANLSTRSPDRVREHYRVERELALRLLEAPKEHRHRLYNDVYDELFRRVDDHPQLEIDPARRSREAARKFRFVSRFVRPESCVMEIGAGDCVFSHRAARVARRVIALDVSEVITAAAAGFPNIDVVLSDGTNVPVEPGCVDVAYSDQLMEHLHPDDVPVQLRNIAEALAPGGVYVCITPNRLTGPHDVSRPYTEVATGLHLREYTNEEVRTLLLESGFNRVRQYAGGRGYYVHLPAWVVRVVERGFARLPWRMRQRAGDLPPVQALLGVAAVASR